MKTKVQYEKDLRLFLRAKEMLAIDIEAAKEEPGSIEGLKDIEAARFMIDQIEMNIDLCEMRLFQMNGGK